MSSKTEGGQPIAVSVVI